MKTELEKKIDLLIEHNGIGLSKKEQELLWLNQKFAKYQHKIFYSWIKTESSWIIVFIGIIAIGIILNILKIFYPTISIIETVYYFILYIQFLLVFYIIPAGHFCKKTLILPKCLKYFYIHCFTLLRLLF